MPETWPSTDPWLRLPEVEREVGLGRSTIYRWMGEGRFPPPKALGGGQVRWPLSVVKAWKDARLDARDGYLPPAPKHVTPREPPPVFVQSTVAASRPVEAKMLQDWRPSARGGSGLPDWPRGMPLEMAAAYVGLSVIQLRESVAASDAPRPIRLTAIQRVWLREDLDGWLNRKAGHRRAPEADQDRPAAWTALLDSDREDGRRQRSGGRKNR